jgi:hypothetical protein
MFHKSASGGSGYSMGMSASIIIGAGGSKLLGGNFYVYNGTPHSSNRSFGVRAVAGNATNGYNYAVYGQLAGTNNGAAIFGATGSKLETNTLGVYAGYFRGDVYVEDDLEVDGTITENSDINLKKDIHLLSDEQTRQIDKLKTLSAIKYKLKTPAELNDFIQAELDTMAVDPRTIEYNTEKYTKDRIGLSAQEVQQVFPELVKVGNDGYLSMNYIGLIPVLVDALKEQEQAIGEQYAEIETLKKEIDKLQSQLMVK